MPPGTVDAELLLPRKGAFGDLAVNGRARQSGAILDGLHTDNSFGSGHRDYLQHLLVDDAPCEQISTGEPLDSSVPSMPLGAIEASDAKTGDSGQQRINGGLRSEEHPQE